MGSGSGSRCRVRLQNTSGFAFGALAFRDQLYSEQEQKQFQRQEPLQSTLFVKILFFYEKRKCFPNYVKNSPYEG